MPTHAVSDRFDETGVWSAIWTNPILVRCPACRSCARVSGSGEGCRITCATCGLAQTTTEYGLRPWSGPVYLRAWQRCSHCGARIDRVTRAPRVPSNISGRFRCSGCGTTNVVARTWYPARWPSAAVDPYFGLPLWLQTSCVGNRLWAFNLAHVGILRRYVGARLRERAPRNKRSWVSRLPTWIKVAKHRERILECLDDLRELAPDRPPRRGPATKRAQVQRASGPRGAPARTRALRAPPPYSRRAR